MGQCQTQELDSIIGRKVSIGENDELEFNGLHEISLIEEEREALCSNREVIKKELSALLLSQNKNPFSPSEQTGNTKPETPTSIDTPEKNPGSMDNAYFSTPPLTISRGIITLSQNDTHDQLETAKHGINVDQDLSVGQSNEETTAESQPRKATLGKGLASMITAFSTPPVRAAHGSVAPSPNDIFDQLLTTKQGLDTYQGSIVSESYEGTAQESLSIKDMLWPLDGLENTVIPEEIEPVAPSDEEDSFSRAKEASNRKNGIIDWEMEQGCIRLKRTSTRSNIRYTSPPRPQSHIKRLHQRRGAQPSSIQYHPPKSTTFGQIPGNKEKSIPNTPPSVDGDVISQFRKLKVQVQLKEQEDKNQKRQAKYEERYKDVQSYRKLYKEFEVLRRKSKDHEDSLSKDQASSKNSRSFDLSQTSAWHFDFKSIDEQGAKYDHLDMRDDQSQFSLLSTTSMESQRQFYTAKKQKKNIRRKSDNSESSSIQNNNGNILEPFFEKTDSRNISLVDMKSFGLSDCSNSRSLNYKDYGPIKYQQHNFEKVDRESQDESEKENSSDYGPIYVKTNKYSGAVEDDISVLSFNSITSSNVRLSTTMHPSISAEIHSIKIIDNKQNPQLEDEHKTPKRSGHSSLENISCNGMKRTEAEVVELNQEILQCTQSRNKLTTPPGVDGERYKQSLNVRNAVPINANINYDNNIEINTKKRKSPASLSSSLKQNIFTHKFLPPSDVDGAEEPGIDNENGSDCGDIITIMNTHQFLLMGKTGGFD